MPGAVADSSTVISLAAIGRLSLLQEFHGKVLIPPVVWREVVTEGRGKPGAAEVEQARLAGWIEVVCPSNEDLVRFLKAELDEGEAEAVALAVECRAEAVFLDEAEARKAAEVYGLPKAGVVGILLRAKLEGRISSLRSELDRLRTQAGFRLSETIYHRVLQEAGENS